MILNSLRSSFCALDFQDRRFYLRLLLLNPFGILAPSGQVTKGARELRGVKYWFCREVERLKQLGRFAGVSLTESKTYGYCC